MIPNSCISSVSGFLTSPYTGWFPVVLAIALAIIGILSVFYMLSPMFGRNNIKTWVKIKIYDIMLSLVLILVFAAGSTFLCAFNFAAIFNAFGLLAKACASDPLVANIYSVALCDLSTFNQQVVTLTHLLFYDLVFFSLITFFMLKLTFFGIGLTLDDTLALPSVFSSLAPVLNTIYTMNVLNGVQLLLLAASPLIFAAFMAIGLVSRVLGFTRTFGGAMIAFAIGIGFVYPLMVGITYGFISSTISNVTGNMLASVVNLITSVVKGMLLGLLSGTLVPTTLTAMLLPFQTLIYQLIEYEGLAGVGLLFIPFLNFIILDAFIVDFSQAIGERMSFLGIIESVL